MKQKIFFSYIYLLIKNEFFFCFCFWSFNNNFKILEYLFFYFNWVHKTSACQCASESDGAWVSYLWLWIMIDEFFSSVQCLFYYSLALHCQPFTGIIPNSSIMIFPWAQTCSKCKWNLKSNRGWWWEFLSAFMLSILVVQIKALQALMLHAVFVFHILCGSF